MSGTIRRALFLTIGQSPRPDILDEMRPWWECGPGARLEIEEAGALDGLDDAAIEALAPEPGRAKLVSRLASGVEVQLDAEAIERRVAEMTIARSRSRGDGHGTAFDFIVLLCTGTFPPMDVRCPLLEAQKIVDHTLAAFAGAARRIGVLVPHEDQIGSFASRPPDGRCWISSHASPYSGDRLARAAEELAAADLVVMHCMGYDEDMRRRVAAVTNKPVLLARRMVASAVAQML